VRTSAPNSLLGPLAGFPHEISHGVELAVSVLATILFLGGWYLAHRQYRHYPGEELTPVRNFLLAGWHADWLADRLVLRPFGFLAQFFQKVDQTGVDGSLEGLGEGCQRSGEWLRQFTTGRVSTYLTAFAWGLVLMLGWVLFALV
jgi:NADH:ubiquinone oxidoreductase subunit 5 (subunit L)/multisubunit Na+/H+ antiporter MnhA subunit